MTARLKTLLFDPRALQKVKNMAKRPETTSTKAPGTAPAPRSPDTSKVPPARRLQPGVTGKPAKVESAGDKGEVLGQAAYSDQTRPLQDVSPGNDELNSGSTPQHTFSDDVISVAAYFMWLNEGCPHGRDLAHWAYAIEDLQRSP